MHYQSEGGGILLVPSEMQLDEGVIKPRHTVDELLEIVDLTLSVLLAAAPSAPSSSGATRALPHIRQAQGSEPSVANSAAAAPPPRGSPTTVAAGESGGATHKARRR